MPNPHPTLEAASLQASPLPPTYFQARAEFAHRFLSGQGLEIGALNWPLEMPPQAHVSQVDRMTVDELRSAYPEMAKLPLPEVDIVDDGETLTTISDGSQDFIVANHFLEHTGDPIGTIETHLSKLKPGGILFYAVPDKRYTFDFRRTTTSLEHLILDHEEGPQRSRHEHFDEWSLLVGGGEVDRDDPAAVASFEERARREARELEASDYSIHTHVWTHASFLAFVLYCRERFGEAFDLEATSQRGLEFVVVLRKTGTWPARAAPAATAEELRRELSQTALELQLTAQELQAAKESLSWRITKPLRAAKDLLSARH